MPNTHERTSSITVRSILLIPQLSMISFNVPTLIPYGSSISIRLMNLPPISSRGYVAAVDDGNKPAIKGQHTDQVFASPKQLKTVKPPEVFLRGDEKGLAISTTEISLLSEISSPIKQRSRCKEKLSSCLSSSLVCRWFTFEWFYSALDYPWFSKREFVEYLNHVGLGNIPRLTRVEWSVIKSSLGKPSRFSEHFLHEERQILEQYRESVRKHYYELRTGVRDGLPTDLARPLYVGQRVIAIHPKTREIHDGSVLTVDHDKCRIQFDRPELGVEFIMEI